MQDETQGLTTNTLLVLSGPPGCGKTTVARALADSAERPTVHLLTDAFYVAIRKGFVPPYLPDAARQNEVVIGVLVEAMLGYARGGYDVVIDGIVGPWSLPSFAAAAQRPRFDLSYVVLRPSLEQTLTRAVAREGKELKASGPVRGLYRAFENLGALEAHVLDSTRDDVEATVRRIRDGLVAGRFALR